MPHPPSIRDDALFQRAVVDEATVFAAKVAVRRASVSAYRALIGFLQSSTRYRRLTLIPSADLSTLLTLLCPPTDVVLAAREIEALACFFQAGGQLRGGAAVQALRSLRRWLRTVGDWVEDDLWATAPTILLGKVAYNKGAVTRILPLTA